MSTDPADLIERGAALRAPLEAAGGLAAVDRFLSSRKDLRAADRELLSWWRDDAVRGVFEIRSADGEALDLRNLVDDLDYRVYRFRYQAEPGMFTAATILPLAEDDSAWLASGDEVMYPASDARPVARLAIDMATREPDLVFRNPEKAKQGWEHMRKDREEFLTFFGEDELVFPTAEAEGRLNTYYAMRRDVLRSARGRHRAVSESGETTFVMPEGFFEFATVGIIYDETDGFVVVPEYGMLKALFADPSLAADREHSNVLRAYLREDAIPPLPLRRVAAAFPAENVDAVYQKILGNRNFAWREHGDGLLRKRKPDYYAEGPTPGVAVLSDRVLELARGAR